MAQIILNELSPDRMPDSDVTCSFYVSKDDKYPIFDDSLFNEDYRVTKTLFEEIYRGHTKVPKSFHQALRISFKSEDLKDWYVIWIPEDLLWTAFEYENLSDYDDFGSTVETAHPWVGKHARISPYIAELLRQYFDITTCLEEVETSEPKNLYEKTSFF